MKIDSLKLGVTTALVWAGGVLVLGLMVALLNWGSPFMMILGSVYKGYGASLAGIAIGTVWALIDGFCAGFLIGIIYNLLPKMGDI